ncbi:acyl-CoA thioesterase [Ornithobacterium rhinotracheale]|uniref:acyl-CoA thioesterase n=1 Tax=Ornithobacterium rhinotracheale TaxID=28251 RepID=UPI00129D03FF|nr:acyl-CoA thioesterase [Ornithobacterium rhinotracheale]MRJ11209.1 acyl-CoA thioesterase [Ornithobacterium rhinotracheale]
MDKQKTPNDSLTVLTNVVLPNETNHLNNMFGGELLSRMDRACSIAARRHAETARVVTASVNRVDFKEPIPLGSIVKVVAKVTRAFTSSMEVIADVWVEDTSSGEKRKTNVGIYTFVAVDANNKPIEIPKITPQSEQETERYEQALRRKQLSLLLSKKIQPSEVPDLKDFLFPEE